MTIAWTAGGERGALASYSNRSIDLSVAISTTVVANNSFGGKTARQAFERLWLKIAHARNHTTTQPPGPGPPHHHHHGNGSSNNSGNGSHPHPSPEPPMPPLINLTTWQVSPLYVLCTEERRIHVAERKRERAVIDRSIDWLVGWLVSWLVD